MRRTVLAIAVVALVSGCQQPPGGPEAEPATADASAPVMPADAPPQEEILPTADSPPPEKAPAA